MFLDISAFIELFLREEQGLGSVWMAALDVGRFTGIFDQPMENGLTYSLGLLAWGYLSRNGGGGTVPAYIALFMLILGGSLGEMTPASAVMAGRGPPRRTRARRSGWRKATTPRPLPCTPASPSPPGCRPWAAP